MKRMNLVAAVVGLVAIAAVSPQAHARHYQTGVNVYPGVAAPMVHPDGPNLYQYVRSNPIGFVDPQGLWTETVHKEYTMIWAMNWNYPREAAKRISDADNAVDDVRAFPWLDRSFVPIWGDQSYHFNRNLNGGTDSRMVHYREHFDKAVEMCDWSKDNDKPEEAAEQLGIALHPLQDWVAHGDYGIRASIGVYFVHNSVSPQQIPGKGDPSSYPDDVGLDAVGMNGNGRPTADKMVWDTETSWDPRSLLQGTRGWVNYTPGSVRLDMTRDMTTTALLTFRGYLIMNARRNCKCWKYFDMDNP